jgi:hypothetical protein
MIIQQLVLISVQIFDCTKQKNNNFKKQIKTKNTENKTVITILFDGKL